MIKQKSKAVACFSVGYQGRRVDELCADLAARGVKLLLDVRQAAWSQRPEFRKTALAEALARHGLEYQHMKEAGNPFRPKKGETVSLTQCIASYRRHLKASHGVVEAVANVLRAKATAVFCFEANHDHCHRSVLLDAVQEHSPVNIARVEQVPATQPTRPRRRRTPSS